MTRIQRESRILTYFPMHIICFAVHSNAWHLKLFLYVDTKPIFIYLSTKSLKWIEIYNSPILKQFCFEIQRSI